MGAFSKFLHCVIPCRRPKQSLAKLDSFHAMTETDDSFWRNSETLVISSDKKTKMTTITVTAMIHSDQLAVVDDLPTDWLECQSEKQDDCRNCGPEWSQEEDLLDVGLSEMSEKKELSLSHQEGDDTEWSEEEDSGWSDEEDSEMSPENKALWESFLNNNDSYNPLSHSCPPGDKIKTSEAPQNHTPSSPTVRDGEDHTPEQSTEGSAKKVRFSDEVTVHSLDAWGSASQAARDGSCWMELARDRDRFKRRVEKAGEIISPCLTAQHRARVLDRLLSLSELYESSLNNTDLDEPLHIPCPAEDKVCASEKPLPVSDQEGDTEIQEGDTKWSEEEDSGWSDEEDSEMSQENRELWESFLYNSDPFHPLYFIGTTKEKVSDSEDEEGEHALSSQEKDNIEWCEEEDSDWSDQDQDGLEMSPENKALWELFLYNSDPFHPLYFSCPPGDKIKTSEAPQNHTPSSPTVREGEDHTPEQSTEGSAKKVRFSEEVTVHSLDAWGSASQAARDGSCWMEMARDKDRFKRRVEKAGEIISPCLTAQHRARVLDRLLSLSELYESSLNNTDLDEPLHIPCPTEDKVCASEKPLPVSDQEGDTEIQEGDTEWSEEKDSEMSQENRELWESPQNHTPLSPTVREGEDHTPKRSTKRSAKKVRFSDKVTIHIFSTRWAQNAKQHDEGRPIKGRRNGKKRRRN